MMKTDVIKRYLAKSPATSTGRMKRPRAGIRSTRKKHNADTTEPTEDESDDSMTEEDDDEIVVPTTHKPQATLIPDDDNSVGGANNIFCCAALADKRQAHCTQMPQAHSQQDHWMGTNIIWSHMTMTLTTFLRFR